MVHYSEDPILLKTNPVENLGCFGFFLDDEFPAPFPSAATQIVGLAQPKGGMPQKPAQVAKEARLG